MLTNRVLRVLIFVAVLVMGVMMTGRISAQTEAPPIVVTTTPAGDVTPAPADATPAPAVTPAPDVLDPQVGLLIGLLETFLNESNRDVLALAPQWLLIGLIIGLVIGYVVTRLTPSKKDDEAYNNLFFKGINLLAGLFQAALYATPPAAPAAPPSDPNASVTTTTETKSQTVSIPVAEDPTIGGERPSGWKDWTPPQR